MTKKKRISGGASIAKRGLKPVLLGLTPEQHERFKRLADLDDRPLTRWIIRAVEAAATLAERDILDSSTGAPDTTTPATRKGSK